MTLNVTLDLPENFIVDIRTEAQTQRRSVADVLRELLLQNWHPTPQLPADVEAELAAMANLSDEVLWLLARSTMATADQARLAELNSEFKERSLDPKEATLLDSLLEQYDRMMVRRAHASSLLAKRGYDLSNPTVLEL